MSDMMGLKNGWSRETMGMDIDTRKLAIAVVEGKLRCVETIQRTNSRGRISDSYDQKLTELARAMQNWGGVVYIEAAYLGKNAETFRALSEVAGEVKRAFRMHRVPVHFVEPSDWQHAVLGQGGKRDEVKEASSVFANSLEGLGEALSQDECDAICIAHYGEMLCKVDANRNA